MSVTSSILKSGNSEYALIASDLRGKAFKLPSLTVLLATDFWYVLFIKLSWGNSSLFLLFPMFHSLVHRSLQIDIPRVLPLLALFFKVDNFSEESQVLTQSLSLVSLVHVHSSLSLLHSCWSTKQLVSLQDDDSLTYTFYLVLFPGLCFPWWTLPSEVLYCISLNTCSKVKDVQSKTFTALNNLFPHICIFE